MPSQPALTPRIVNLKAHRFWGDTIAHTSGSAGTAPRRTFFRKASMLSIRSSNMPDMFITGVKIEDIDGLEHLEPFVERKAGTMRHCAQRRDGTLPIDDAGVNAG